MEKQFISADLIKLFEAYIEYFKEYNSKINLISKNDENVIFEKHICDSLGINGFFEKYNIGERINLLDIGAGGGFPSIPLAMYYKNINVTSVDSVNKKINYIKKVATDFNLENINAMCSRIEDLDKRYKNSFDIVTSRAMAELRIILEYALPYIKNGGYFVAYKSKKAEDEIKNAQNALGILGAKIIDKINYSLPIEGIDKRVLIVIKKYKETPLIYPRKNGVIKKTPL